MKAVQFALVTLAIAGSFSAHAIVRQGWERPTHLATLTEVDDAGHEARNQTHPTLTMNKLDGAQSATSLTFNETIVRYCITAPCPALNKVINLRIQGSPKVVGPDMWQYKAKELKAITRHSTFPATATLTENRKSGQWSLTLDEKNTAAGVRHFEGEYGPVYTIQGAGGVQ